MDHLLTRPEVDAGKIALLGVSQAGYWVPRSVAFEHRIAAAVADPDHEQFWSGQSQELYDKLPAGETLIRFTEEGRGFSLRASG